jgi:hypothetical protein
MPVYLDRDELIFHADDVHPDARFSLAFQRTLRIPDDGRDHPLPPGLGRFPLRHVEDHADRLPQGWVTRGGVMFPMYQAEAMWILFSGGGYPFAVKIAAGKINAVSGERWSPGLNRDPQDYCVLPEQPWLDGYAVERGVIRQFVAMPLGQGYTAEEQLTGAAEWGGVQIVAYPMKAERWEELRRRRAKEMRVYAMRAPMVAESAAMGLAPGGRMRQVIVRDRRPLDVWDQRHGLRCHVAILNSADWAAATGSPAPQPPVSARDYTAAGLPWYDYYAEAPAVPGAAALASLKSVAALARERHGDAGDLAEPVPVQRVLRIGQTPGRAVTSAF